MLGRKKISWPLLIIAIMLNIGCSHTIVHPRHGLAIDQMHDEMQAGIKDDRASAKSYIVPKSVSYALLPTVSDESRSEMPEKRFDVSANQIPAKAFFMGLVEGTRYNMVVNPDVNGFISLELKNVTINQVLEAVRDIYGFEFHRNSYGYEVLAPNLETQIFTVNYLDVKRKGKSVTEMTSGQISEQVSTTSVGGTAASPTPTTTGGTQSITAGSTVETRSEANFWHDLEISLKAIIGNQNGRSIVVNSQSGVIIVKAFPPELHKIARYLERIQTNMERQVVLEAKVLEVSLNDQFQSGIDWNLIGKVIDGSGGIAQTASETFANTTLADFTSFFTVRINGNFGTLIKLLQSQGNVQVLSSPRISTINNQKAVIKVGTDQFFVTGVSTTNVTSGLSNNVFPTQNINLTPFFSGVTLDVTPQISGDGEVTLHIHPTVSVVQDQEKTIVLGNNGTTNAQNTYVLPLAQSTIRESDNIVHARNGQVIVIGGLMQNNMEEQVAGLPGLSKLPFIGFLFRRTEQVATKIELVVLLRPLLANNTTWRAELKKGENTMDNMHRGFHEGGLSEVFGNEGEENKS